MGRAARGRGKRVFVLERGRAGARRFCALCLSRKRREGEAFGGRFCSRRVPEFSLCTPCTFPSTRAAVGRPRARGARAENKESSRSVFAAPTHATQGVTRLYVSRKVREQDQWTTARPDTSACALEAGERGGRVKDEKSNGLSPSRRDETQARPPGPRPASRSRPPPHTHTHNTHSPMLSSNPLLARPSTRLPPNGLAAPVLPARRRRPPPPHRPLPVLAAKRDGLDHDTAPGDAKFDRKAAKAAAKVKGVGRGEREGAQRKRERQRANSVSGGVPPNLNLSSHNTHNALTTGGQAAREGGRRRPARYGRQRRRRRR